MGLSLLAFVSGVCKQKHHMEDNLIDPKGILNSSNINSWLYDLQDEKR
jgi:hypothetical protein